MTTADSLSPPTIDGEPGYWSLSRQPLASLIFVSPLLVAYEAGVVILGPQGVRNGADAWLRLLLDGIGFGQYFLLPILTVAVLLGWHFTTRHPWHVPASVFWGMAIESALMAVCLRLILQLQFLLLAVPAEPEPGVVQQLVQFLRIRVGFLGAGIYEELLFRVLLLWLLIWSLEACRLPRGTAVVAAVIVSSLLFSAAHYVAGREAILWFSFLFRFLAGVFFSLLFLYRGFGITAGAHAGYDILVGLI